MRKFLINVSTNWCGTDATYRAVAEYAEDLEDLAQELAIENLETYDYENLIAEDNGYDPDEMNDHDWDELWRNTSESEYCDYSIEEFEGSDEEWDNGYGRDIYTASGSLL